MMKKTLTTLLSDLKAWMKEAFDHDESEYKFWIKLKQGDWRMPAAQYYGQMCAIVNLERELLGEHAFADRLKKLDTPFVWGK